MTDTAMGGAPASAPAHTPNVDRMVAALLKPPAAGEKPLPGTEEKPETVAAQDATETPAAPVVEPPKEPEPKKSLETARLAEALVKYERSEASRLKVERRLKELETQLAEAATDPTKALALGKHDPEALIAAMLDGKVKKPSEPEQTPEQKAVAELQSKLAELEKERDEVKAKESYRQEIDIIKGKIADREIAGVFPWSADRIRADFYAEYERTGEEPDLDAIIEKFETGVAGEMRLALSSERAFQKLVSDPKVREMVVKALGLPATETSKPAQQDKPRATTPEEGPSVITSKMAAEIPERRASDIRPRAERVERSLNILLAAKGKK